MLTVKSNYRGTMAYVRVLTELVRKTEYRGVTTYQDIAVIMGLPIKGRDMGTEIAQILGQISEDETLVGRPMLSSVAVNVGGVPGPGFYALAKDLNRMDKSITDETFWKTELNENYAVWKRVLPKVQTGIVT